MSFGDEFNQSPMDSFVYKKQGVDFGRATPHKSVSHLGSLSNNNHDDNNAHCQNENHNSNDNNRRATKYDYLDYGNFLNRILSSSQFLAYTDNGFEEINWNLPRTTDKVNIINTILAIIENKKLYESLLKQSRDTIESLKIDRHSSEMHIKSVSQQNKQLNQEMRSIMKRKEYLEAELKKQSNSFKEKLKQLTKENENLRYRDKKYQNDIRKKEKVYTAQREKIAKLLNDRDKKSYKLKCLVLNQQIPNSILTSSHAVTSKESKEHQTKQRQQHLQSENNMLQSQVAHLQKQLESVLTENNLLRESLLRLEINCKKAMLKINDLFANNSNQIRPTNSLKYSMPFDKDTQQLIDNDIQELVELLSTVLDELKTRLVENYNMQNLDRMQQEIARLKSTIEELQQNNKELESLIRTYVNSE